MAVIYIMAMIIIVAMGERGTHTPMGVRSGDEFARVLAGVLRKAGWRVHRHPAMGDPRADLVGEAGGKKYVIALKRASEGRRDRLIPLLSQAILEARAMAHGFPNPAVPMAVVAARRVPESVAGQLGEQLRQFARRYAPEAGIGVIDSEGFRSFAGAVPDGLDAKASRPAAGQLTLRKRAPDPFSDLNQWMLKMVLGQSLPESLIQIPRAHFRNASGLAREAEARVSVMSAFRFVSQFAQEGFLDKDESQLRIVRVKELLELWISASHHAFKEIPARWRLRKGPGQLQSALRAYASRAVHHQPQCCLGLFAAADALGLGFVHGAPLHIYVERITLDSLDGLGLAIDDNPNRPADLRIRIPANPKAVFRASVVHDGVPVSDVLQVYLDVSTHPARGREQAREIERRVLKPLFETRR